MEAGERKEREDKERQRSGIVIGMDNGMKYDFKI